MRQISHTVSSIIPAHSIHDVISQALNTEPYCKCVEAEVVVHTMRVGGTCQKGSLEPANKEGKGELVNVGVVDRVAV